MIADALSEMTSGECRWIGQEDVHVYCWHPARKDRTFKVVWPDGRREGLTPSEAERLVFALAKEARPWKPAG